MEVSVADPGFPRGGANPTGGGTNLLFGIIVDKNLHENEKNGMRG